MLELLVYTVLLLVVMPLLLLGAGRFAKYCSPRKQDRTGLQSDEPLKPGEL